jgi:hypothetical protein
MFKFNTLHFSTFTTPPRKLFYCLCVCVCVCISDYSALMMSCLNAESPTAGLQAIFLLLQHTGSFVHREVNRRLATCLSEIAGNVLVGNAWSPFNLYAVICEYIPDT